MKKEIVFAVHHGEAFKDFHQEFFSVGSDIGAQQGHNYYPNNAQSESAARHYHAKSGGILLKITTEELLDVPDKKGKRGSND